MENRRAIYDKRNKVKNTHEKYKPNKGELDDRVKAQRKRGRVQGPIEDLEPSVYTKVSKTVVTEACVICFYPFVAPSVICPNCRNCQSCGKYTEDAYSNNCIHCGNHVDGPRLDNDVPQMGAPA